MASQPTQPTLTAARVSPSGWVVRARRIAVGDCFHDGQVARKIVSEPFLIGYQSYSCRVVEETGQHAGNLHQAFIDLRD